MRVLLQTSVEDISRGPDQVIRRIADAARRSGLAAHIVLMDSKLSPGELVVVNDETIRIGSSTRPDATYARAVRELLDEYEPDVVNCHMVDYRCFPFIDARIRQNFTLVGTFHGVDTFYMTQGLASGIRRRCGLFDAVTAVSWGIADALAATLRIATPIVIHNGIPLDEWPPRPDPDNGRVVSVGGLDHFKGHDVLLAAFKEVVDAIPAATLTIVGEGPLRDRLINMRHTLNLEEHVELTGHLSTNRVRRALQTASVFAFPSRNEGFGIALLEAMAMEVASVASSVGGIEELLGQAGGLLVPPDDSTALAEALRRLLTDRDVRRRKSQAAGRRAKQFDEAKMTDGYLRLYEELAGRGAKQRSLP